MPLDQGPCPAGYTHMFDGYMSCALDSSPCAAKVLSGDAANPVLMDDCDAACGGCLGLSLYDSTECWVYTSWTGTQRVDEASVICKRNAPPPPPRPPPPRSSSLGGTEEL